MPNHYHLVIRTGQYDLWRTMKPLNMRYAQYHGDKYGRRGPLFMDRYKSIATQDQNYVQELVRYVHLNPLRSGMCKTLDDLDRYDWTGHSALMGNRSNGFQDTSSVLNRFGADVDGSRTCYRDFLDSGLKKGGGDNDELLSLVRASNAGVEKGRDARLWVIGDPAFIKKAVHEAHRRRLRIRKWTGAGPDFDPVTKKVCDEFGIDQSGLFIRHRGGPVSMARKAFVWLCVRKLEIPTTAVAEFLKISPGAVSNMIEEGKTIVETGGTLRI